MAVRIGPGDPGSPDFDVRTLFRDDPAEPAAGMNDPAGNDPAGNDADVDAPVAGPIARPRRPRWARSLPRVGVPRMHWSRIAAWVLVLALGGAVVGVLGWRLSIPAPTNGATPPQQPAQPTRPEPPVPSAAPQISAVAWQGTALPISDQDGPHRFTQTQASGFSRNPQGAALAAVHISTHIDPYTGPAVFTPAIEQQVVGKGGALLRRTRSSYESNAERMGVTDGAPILAPTGSIEGWRIADFDSSEVSVDLLVQTPAGQRVVYQVPLRWEDGDWKMSVPQVTDELFAVSAAGDESGFTPFVELPGAGR